MGNKIKKEWWENSFEEEYLATYIDAIAANSTKKEVSFLLKALKLRQGADILDLACGHGRHAIELVKRGYSVTGFDFSRHFIELAKKEARQQDVKVDFIRDDMRNLSFKNKFDAVINMFTSFGYFGNEDDNERVLRKISRALKPGGIFLLDLVNPINIFMQLAPEKKFRKKTNLLKTVYKDKLSNGIILMTESEFNPEKMVWSMIQRWKQKGKMHSYKIHVRVFTLPELKHLFEENGLVFEKAWGDFDASPFSYNSRRLIVLARKI